MERRQVTYVGHAATFAQGTASADCGKTQVNAQVPA
jgi:hypothetical protein